MSTGIRSIAALITLLGCGVSHPWAVSPRPASGLPDRFLADPAIAIAAPPGCSTRLRDPRDGTTLRLERSTARASLAGATGYTAAVGAQGTLGDYRVEDGRYGVGPEELLRVECESGRPLGIVPRKA